MYSMMNNVATGNYDPKMVDWHPSVEVESYGGIREVSLWSKHFGNRKLFLTGEVTSEMANTFVSELLYLAQSNEPIDIYINSPGGSVNAGLVIYDVIQSCEGKIPINMYCVGSASSMVAVILAGGQKGRRYILPHSKVMIHEPLISGGMGGSATTIKKSIFTTFLISYSLYFLISAYRFSTHLVQHLLHRQSRYGMRPLRGYLS